MNTEDIEKLIKDNEKNIQTILMSKIKALEEEQNIKQIKITNLETTLDKLKKEYTETVNLIDERDSDINILQSEYDLILESIDIKDSEINLLTRKLNDLENKIKQEESNSLAIEENYKLKLIKQSNINKEKNSILEIENDSLKSNIKLLYDKINELNDTLTMINRKNEDIINKNNEQREKINCYEKDITNFQNTILKQDSQIKIYLDNIDKLNSSNEAIMKDLIQSRRVEAELSKTNELYTNNITDLNEKYYLLKTKNTTISEELIGYKIENQHYLNQVNEYKEKFTATLKEKDQLEERVFSLNQEVINLETLLKKEKKGVKNEKQSINELTDTISNLEDELKKINEKYNKLIKENKLLKQKDNNEDELNEKLNEIKTQLEKTMQEKGKLYSENMKLKDEISDLNNKIKDNEKHINLFSERIDSTNFKRKNNNTFNKNNNNNNNNNYFNNNPLANSIDKIQDFLLNASNEDFVFFRKQNNNGNNKEEERNNENNSNVNNNNSYLNSQNNNKDNYLKDQQVRTLQANLEEKKVEIEGLKAILEGIENKIMSINSEYEEEKNNYINRINELELNLAQEKLNSSNNNDYNNFQTNVQAGFNEFKLKDEISKIKKDRDKLATLCSSLRQKNSSLENQISSYKKKINSLVFKLQRYEGVAEENNNRTYSNIPVNHINFEMNYDHDVSPQHRDNKINFNKNNDFFGTNMHNTRNNNIETGHMINPFYTVNFDKTKNIKSSSLNNAFSSEELEELQKRKNKILTREMVDKDINNRKDVNLNDMLPFDGVSKVRRSTSNHNKSKKSNKSLNKDLNNYINIRKIVYDTDENNNNTNKNNNNIMYGEPLVINTKSTSNSKSRGKKSLGNTINSNTKLKNFKLIKGSKYNKN